MLPSKVLFFLLQNFISFLYSEASSTFAPTFILLLLTLFFFVPLIYFYRLHYHFFTFSISALILFVNFLLTSLLLFFPFIFSTFYSHFYVSFLFPILFFLKYVFLIASYSQIYIYILQFFCFSFSLFKL